MIINIKNWICHIYVCSATTGAIYRPLTSHPAGTATGPGRGGFGSTTPPTPSTPLEVSQTPVFVRSTTSSPAKSWQPTCTTWTVILVDLPETRLCNRHSKVTTPWLPPSGTTSDGSRRPKSDVIYFIDVSKRF